MGSVKHERWRPRTPAVVLALAAISLFVTGSVSASSGLTAVQVPQQLCPAATAHRWSCDAFRLATEHVSISTAKAMRAAGLARPAVSYGHGPNGGYSPTDLATAYGVNPAASTTQTVGIVDAYNDPSVLADLNFFDSHYGLPAETGSSFEVVNETGAVIDPETTSSPNQDVDWSGEISLDVETVRGLCNACRIVLVETDSNSSADLAQGVDAAVSLGATIVSNSYGGPESPGDPYASDYNRPGVAILASAGDDGWYDWDLYDDSYNLPEVPASYSTVVGVGGTSLTMTTNDTARTGETVWNDDGPEDSEGGGATGGGCSTVYAAPPWEQAVAGYASLGCGPTARSGVDVAADADYLTGFDTYETTASWCIPGMKDWNGNDCPSSDPDWQTYGGTSLSSPLVAAMWALAGGPQGVTYPALTLYGHFQTGPSQFNDITSGGNGFCDTDSAATCFANTGDENPNELGDGLLDCRWDQDGDLLANIGQCNAETGFDGVSGVGTPNGVAPFQPLSPIAAIGNPGAVTQGVAAEFSAAGSSTPFPGDSITQYQWSWGDGTTTTTSSPTASHVYVVAGAHTVTLTVTDAYSADNGGRAGQASVGVNVVAVNHTLKVSKTGSGSGKVNGTPAGISCGATCSHSYAYGTAVTLTADASSGSKFAGWSGGGCSGTRACVVTLSADQRVGAKFVETCKVPRVTGHKLAAARRAIAHAHCRVGKIRHAYSKVKKGRVSAEKPKAGTHHAAGAKVSLTLSKGRKPKKK
jgi:PKD domain/Divergent InlB B-repeat domain/PASTA domain